MNDLDGTSEIALARAELWFSVNYEMVNSLEDFFVRRTGRLYFDIESIPIVRDAVVKDITTYLKWNDQRLAVEQKRLDDLIYDATNYYEREFNTVETIS